MYPVGFHFLVRFSISGDEVDLRFQSVSGLSVEYETESITEGGVNTYVHELPGRTKYSPLVLKRAYALDSKVADWFRAAMDERQFQPADLQISLLNEEHTPLKTWKVNWAVPKKWSISDFNAEENSLVIETMELNYRFFKTL